VTESRWQYDTPQQAAGYGIQQQSFRQCRSEGLTMQSLIVVGIISIDGDWQTGCIEQSARTIASRCASVVETLTGSVSRQQTLSSTFFYCCHRGVIEHWTITVGRCLAVLRQTTKLIHIRRCTQQRQAKPNTKSLTHGSLALQQILHGQSWMERLSEANLFYCIYPLQRSDYQSRKIC